MNISLGNQSAFRRALISGMLFLMIVATCFTSTAATQREFTVLDGGATAVFKTTKNTVGEAIKETNIALSPLDIVSVDLDTPVDDVDFVEIKRAKDIHIIDGKDAIYTVESAYETAEEILAQHKIDVGEDDYITFNGSYIRITRVVKKEQVISEPIAFETVYENDSTLFKGNQKVKTEGENGSADVVYSDTYKNGEFVSREKTSSTVTKEPVNKVIKVGTKSAPVVKAVNAAPSGAGAPTSYKKVITCRATAYDGSYETLGKHNPRTALGRVPTVGTVAVDPRVIPLGTQLYIETTDGSYVYGYCFAGDTGGAIKGNRVDLFMASRNQALSFGSRQVNVYIL